MNDTSNGIASHGIAYRGIAWLGVGSGGGAVLPDLIQCLELGVYGTFEVNDTLSPLIVTSRARYGNNNVCAFQGSLGDCIANTHISDFNSTTDELEMWFNLRTAELQGLDYIFGAWSATKIVSFGCAATDWNCDFGAAGSGASGIAFRDGWSRIRVAGGIFTLYDLDGTNPVELFDASAQGDFDVLLDIIIGARNEQGVTRYESPIDVAFWEVKRNGIVKQSLTFAEGEDDVLFDGSGLSNHALLVDPDFSTVDPACLALVRAGKTDIGPAHNIENGFNYLEAPQLEFTIEVGAGISFTVPTEASASYNGVITFGDSDGFARFTTYNDANLTHTYAGAGTYTIRIYGTFGHFYFNNGGDKTLFRTLVNMGYTNTSSIDKAFYGASGATAFSFGDTCPADLAAITTAIDTWRGNSVLLYPPDMTCLSGLINASGTFIFCTALLESPDLTNSPLINRLYFTFAFCDNIIRASDISSLNDVFTLQSTWQGDLALRTITLPDNLSNMRTMVDICNGTTLDTADSAGQLGIDGIITHVWDEIQNGHIVQASWTDINIHLGNGKYSAAVASKLADIVAEGFVVITGGQV